MYVCMYLCLQVEQAGSPRQLGPSWARAEHPGQKRGVYSSGEQVLSEATRPH
jgi:hypothetical protein